VAFNDLANAAAAQLRRRQHHATSVCFLDQASGNLVDTHKRLVLDDFNISAKLRNHHARPCATVAHARAQRDNGLPNDVGYLTDSTRHRLERERGFWYSVSSHGRSFSLLTS
jgi:hypothetical protein